MIKSFTHLLHRDSYGIFVRYPHLLSAYTRVRYGFVLGGVVALWLNYKINVTARLTGFQINNFIDSVISPLDIYVVAVWVVFVLARYQYMRWFTLINGLFLVCTLVVTGFEPSWLQWVLVGARLGVLITFLYEIIKNKMIATLSKVVCVAGLGTIALFDYYLITESVIAGVFGIMYLFISTPKSDIRWYPVLVRWGIELWFMVNSGLSVYQLLTGTSLGLKYIGESVLDVTQRGIAKQIIPLFDIIVLRPYGLAAHPNVLAGVGVVGLLWGCMILSSYSGQLLESHRITVLSVYTKWLYYMRTHWWGVLLIVNGLFLVIIAMSRGAYGAVMACVIVGMCWMYYMSHRSSKSNTNTVVKNLMQRYYNVAYGICICTVVVSISVVIGLLSTTRLGTSDIYRGQDMQRFITTVDNLSPVQQLLGIGIGQYQQLLYARGGLESWQYQPVHSVYLYVLISLGVIQSILAALFVLLVVRYTLVFAPHIKSQLRVKKKVVQYNQDDVSLPMILYIQWYISGDNARDSELLEAVTRNYQQSLFTRIIITYNNKHDIAMLTKHLSLYSSSSVVEYRYFSHRACYSDYYSITQTLPRHIVVIANTDIVFDESVYRARHYLVLGQSAVFNRTMRFARFGFVSLLQGLIYSLARTHTLLAITRYEEEGGIMPDGRVDYWGSMYSHAQDVWIVLSDDAEVFNCPIALGSRGCDHQIALQAAEKRYTLINSYDVIRTGHLHGSNVRTSQTGSVYKGWRIFPTTTPNQYSMIWE